MQPCGKGSRRYAASMVSKVESGNSTTRRACREHWSHAQVVVVNSATSRSFHGEFAMGVCWKHDSHQIAVVLDVNRINIQFVFACGVGDMLQARRQRFAKRTSRRPEQQQYEPLQMCRIGCNRLSVGTRACHAVVRSPAASGMAKRHNKSCRNRALSGVARAKVFRYLIKVNS